MYKHQFFSGFYGTDLDAVLKRAGVKDLIVTGCTTSVLFETRCLETSAASIGRLHERALSETTCPGVIIKRLLVMQTLFAWVSDSNHFVQRLES